MVVGGTLSDLCPTGPSKLSANEATVQAHPSDLMTIDGRTYPRDDIAEILGGRLDALPMSVRDATRLPLGTCRGLRSGLVLHSQFPPDVYLEGSTTRQTILSREHQGLRTILNALDRLAAGYGSEIFDLAGRQVASIDPLNRRNTTVFDAANRTVARIDPLLFRATTVYDAAGRGVASINQLGNRWTSVYDSLSTLSSTVNPLGRRSTTIFDAASLGSQTP